MFGNWILQPILQPLSQAWAVKQCLEIASGAIPLPCCNFTRVLCKEHANTDSLPFPLKRGGWRGLAFWELSLACDDLQEGKNPRLNMQCFNTGGGSQTSPSLTLHGLEYTPMSSGHLNLYLTSQRRLCQLANVSEREIYLMAPYSALEDMLSLLGTAVAWTR